MDHLIYLLFVSISVPVLLMAPLVEKRARLPIMFVLAGLFVAVFAAEVNGLLRGIIDSDPVHFTTTVTPITEELLKTMPVLFFALLVSDEREKLFTASMATGIGFALLENAYHLLQNVSSFHLLDAVVRAFGAGLMHGMCTLLVGVGISYVKKRRKIFAVGTFALLSTAVTYHGIYNMLIQSPYSAAGALLPIATYVPFFIWRLRLRKGKKGSSAEP